VFIGAPNRDDITILDGRDDQKRAALIAEQLTRWKSFRNT
jgi:hypothetical protein